MRLIREVIYWVSFLTSSGIVLVNLIALSRYETTIHPSTVHATSQRMKEDFKASLHDTNSELDSNTNWMKGKETSAAASRSKYSVSQAAATKHVRRSRTLVGIISSDTLNDSTYRKRHRELFQIWNDPRVCSLAELRAKTKEEGLKCQLVYTFVIGAAQDKNSNSTASAVMNEADASIAEQQPQPVTLISNASLPLYRTTPLNSRYNDINYDDVTLLNIKYVSQSSASITLVYFCQTHLAVACSCDRENMNEGSKYISHFYKQLL